MTQERWRRLMDDTENILWLTEDEIKEGWHFCWDWDGLLVGPTMGELEHCTCLAQDHPARKTIPPTGPLTLDSSGI